MTEPPSQKSPAERALDLAVYAPLGLALSIAEAMPAMARKGRSRFVPRVGLARTVGQLAVQQGYRQLRDMAASGPNIPFLARGPARANGAVRPAHDGPPAPSTDKSGSSGPPGQPARTASRATTGRPTARKAPRAMDLAIPSYDSLSASQVVQRLAGLSVDEVAAVQAYESATRGVGRY